MMIYFTEGIILGATTSISCFIFCLPVFLGASLNNKNSSLINFSFFTLGRFTAYLIIGAIASIIGKELLHISFFDSSAKIATGVLLLYWGIKGFSLENKKCVVKKKACFNPVAAGFLIGISPCPPFLAGIALAMSSGSINKGIVFFIGFFISTTFLLIPFISLGLVKYKEELKIISQFISIISGGLFLIYGIINLF